MSSSSASKAARKSSLDTTSLLAQSRLFRNVPVETVRRAAERGALRELGPGQILFWQGERGDILYFVIEGELRSVRQDARGREQVLATHHAGAVLDLVSGVDSGPFYCTVIADTNSRLLCLEKRVLDELCRESPDLLWNVGLCLAGTIRHYAEVIETLALRNVDQRVAQFLLSLCEQTAAQNGDCRELKLTMTQPEMAAHVGSTREVVCRALAHLQKQGLIVTNGPHHIRIPDIRALRKFAGVESALEPRP